MKQFFTFILRKMFWGFGRHLLSDKWYAKIRYKLELDSWPDLQNPQKFSEKIQWIKLNERNSLRKMVASRLKVRNYVADKTSKKYLIPLIDSFETLTESVWKSLPGQFVLKANHGCGMLHITFDKAHEVYETLLRQTEQWKQTSYYKFGREWVYKGLPRIILAEELLLNSEGDIPRDYKFFCFHGEVKIIQVDYARFGEQKRNLFDSDFNRIKSELLYPPYEGEIEKPSQLEEAIAVGESLSAEFSFIRVDLYLLDEQIYFGELTNYPGNGFVPFEPENMEYKIGSLLEL